MTIERQLRWNFISESNPTKHTIHLVIIGDTRQINRIKQRSQVEFEPTDEMYTIRGGVLESEGLRFNSSSFVSYMPGSPTEINWKRIYLGRVIRDEEIYLRQNQKNAEEFMQTYLRRLSQR